MQKVTLAIKDQSLMFKITLNDDSNELELVIPFLKTVFNFFFYTSNK